MAWNHPTESKAIRPKRKVNRSLWMGVAVAVATVTGVVIAFCCCSDAEKPAAEDASKTKQIPTRNPASAAPVTRTAPTARPIAAVRSSAPTNRVELTKNVKPPTVLGCNYYECVSGGRPLFTKPIFTNSAENIIGGLLSARPGERFVPVDLGEDFDNDFAASLEVPIEVTTDDSPDNVIIKDAVSRAKKLIAESMSRGQKPSEVVMSMRDEMNKVADYRDLLQEDFDALKETGSADEIESYLKEANALLDEFGAARLDLPEDEIEEINTRLSKDK